MIHAELGNLDLVQDCCGDDGDTGPLQPNQLVNITLPRKLKFLLELHDYKVIYGGRGGGKSWAVADALLALGAAQKLRILCAREVQKSIAQSVHQLLKDRIVALGLTNFYTVLDTEIRGGNGTLFVFSGLGEHTVDSIKSFEGIDIVWVEEAQTVSKKSWEILIPTIRKDKSEIWVTFNPGMDTDDTWKRFIIDPPEGCVSVEMNWGDNKRFPANLEKKRLDAKRRMTKEEYENIWEGKCRTSVEGAIYAREMAQMAADKRNKFMPYDPRLQVHFIWDLGWNDAMSITMVQKPHPSVVSVINYLEVSFLRYDQVVLLLKALGYTRWGWHWLPHDGNNANPQTGKGARETLKALGCRVKPCMEKTGPEQRIKAARQAFPRIYIDGTDRSDTLFLDGNPVIGYLGGQRLLECLRRYSRHVPKNTNEPASVKHDEYSHGCDSFGAMCEIADQIVDDEYVEKIPILEPYHNPNRGMGTLG